MSLLRSQLHTTESTLTSLSRKCLHRNYARPQMLNRYRSRIQANRPEPTSRPQNHSASAVIRKGTITTVGGSRPAVRFHCWWLRNRVNSDRTEDCHHRTHGRPGNTVAPCHDRKQLLGDSSATSEGRLRVCWLQSLITSPTPCAPTLYLSCLCPLFNQSLMQQHLQH